MSSSILHALPADEVRRRLSVCPSEQLPAVHDLGRFLLEHAVTATSRLDSKATTIGGYAGAILSFLVVGLLNWFPQLGAGELTAVLVAALAAGVAAVLAVVALRVRGHDWISDEQWFDEDAMKAGDVQIGFYTTVLHTAHDGRVRMNQRKARAIASALWALAGAAVALAAGVAVGVGYDIVGSGLDGCLEHGVGRAGLRLHYLASEGALAIFRAPAEGEVNR
jgi:hypothetical protein